MDDQKQQQQQQALVCPRCESANTKFCYYNNYNKLQPRHLCRSCKRHWTVGGTLRDVSTGGRAMNKRSSKSIHYKKVPKGKRSTGKTRAANHGVMNIFTSSDEALDHKNDDNSGCISSGRDKKDSEISSECYDVVADDIVPHEMFSFELLPEVSDHVEFGTEDQQQWQVPDAVVNVGMFMRWEEDDTDMLCASDFLTTDVPELM